MFNQIRNILNRTQIFQTHNIRRLLSIHPIRQSAWLRTLSAITASSPYQTAEQTLSGIAITKSSMYKTLNLKIGPVTYFLNLRKRKLSCRNHSYHALLLQPFCWNCIRNRHLRTGMDIHLRKLATNIFHHTHILYNYCIQPLLIVWEKISI